MSIFDHKSDGKYFKPGEYKVRVMSSKDVHYKSGNDGFEVTLSDGQREIRTNFVFTDKALWKLANFCEALGMSDTEMKRMEPESPALQKWMRGRSCMILVNKGKPNTAGKSYSEVEDFYAVTSPLNAPPVKSESEEMPPVVDDVEPPTGDDIPF